MNYRGLVTVFFLLLSGCATPLYGQDLQEFLKSFPATLSEIPPMPVPEKKVATKNRFDWKMKALSGGLLGVAQLDVAYSLSIQDRCLGGCVEGTQVAKWAMSHGPFIAHGSTALFDAGVIGLAYWITKSKDPASKYFAMGILGAFIVLHIEATVENSRIPIGATTGLHR